MMLIALVVAECVYRMDDSSLLMERYRSLMQPSSAAAAAYYPYHAAAAAGLLPPGSSVNPFLQAAAAAGASRYPADMMSAAFPFYSGLMSAGGKGSESLLSLPGSSSHSDRCAMRLCHAHRLTSLNLPCKSFMFTRIVARIPSVCAVWL